MSIQPWVRAAAVQPLLGQSRDVQPSPGEGRNCPAITPEPGDRTVHLSLGQELSIHPWVSTGEDRCPSIPEPGQGCPSIHGPGQVRAALSIHPPLGQIRTRLSIHPSLGCLATPKLPLPSPHPITTFPTKSKSSSVYKFY